MTGPVDVAIIGGGAAGIAAARYLFDQKRSVLLIEALPRLGGRAHTVILQDMALDLGCGWLHSAERNPLRMLAEASGQTIDRSEAAWYRQLHDINFSTEDQHQAWVAYQHLLAQLRCYPPPSDTAGDALPRDDRWRPFIDGISSFINGTELDHLSAADFMTYDTASSDNNWRLPNGYGAFIVGRAADIPLAPETCVTAIEHGKRTIVQTNRGAIEARAAIVTVSSDVLQRNSIDFTPPVDTHLHAASCLPLGLANKVYLSIADPAAVPAESHLLARHDSAATGSYYLRPFGRPVIECFLGGSLARALEDAGVDATVAFVIDELRQCLGGTFAKGLAPIAVTRWAHEPTIGGSYSHARPGHADARRVLAEPVHEYLCFAGEACSIEDFSTAHGAWQSGLAAAHWIDRWL